MTLFSYPGGKTKLANVIIPKLNQLLINDNMEYREPFFGGGSIGLKFLARNKKITNIWINDKDQGIACIWTSVIRYPYILKDIISKYKPKVDDFFYFRDELSKIPEEKNMQNFQYVLYAFKKIVVHQISYSSLGMKSGGPRGGTEQNITSINSRWYPNKICRSIDRYHKVLNRFNIKENKCTCVDFEKLIDSEDKDVMIYLDPPYYVKGNELYLKFFNEEDHKRLSESLRRTNHGWLLSYDCCEPIKQLCDWAYVEDIDVTCTISPVKDKETGDKQCLVKKEVLISKDKIEYKSDFLF